MIVYTIDTDDFGVIIHETIESASEQIAEELKDLKPGEFLTPVGCAWMDEDEYNNLPEAN